MLARVLVTHHAPAPPGAEGGPRVLDWPLATQRSWVALKETVAPALGDVLAHVASVPNHLARLGSPAHFLLPCPQGPSSALERACKAFCKSKMYLMCHHLGGERDAYSSCP